MKLLGMRKQTLQNWKMIYRLGLLLSILFLLNACAAQVSYEKLFPGVKQVRTDLKVHIEFSEDPNEACRNEVKAATGKAPPVMVYYGACAIIEPDANLKPGVLPTCKIILPKDSWHKAMEHEIFHCLGYDHE
jgi:hypothetical protein